MKRLFVLAALVLFTGSCSISREIRVIKLGNRLAIDFPWSFWRVAGLQEREYPCVDLVELFDSERVLWTLDAAKPSGSCADVRMPIAIGRPKAGFIAKGAARLRPGRYGVSVRSYAPARVDFVLQSDGSVRNVTEWNEQMPAPCGTYFGSCAPGERNRQVDPGSRPG